MWIGTYQNPKPEDVESYLEAWHTKADAVFVTG